MNTPPAMLHPELLAHDDGDRIVRDGRRLDHAEAASKPLHSRPEPQPRGAKVHGNRPIDQAEAAARFIAAPEHEKMHDERLWDLRQKRDREMHGIAEWEVLRSLASAIKEHTLTHLDEYLEQFEANARANGVHVHWAKDAAEHNRIVHGILRDHGAKSLIKSKSMLTEECGFRHYMASVGIEVVETDLGERIQQLDNEDPSHVVVPAVHKLRTDVAEVFARRIGTDPENSDVHYLAEAQREATRPLILKADAGMTGCNFAVAETGTSVVCTTRSASKRSSPVSITWRCSSACCRAALAAFKKGLTGMGGLFLDPQASGDTLAPVRAKIAGAKIVCSTVPEIAGNRDVAGVGAPQDLADVDFAIVRASFAVAETGSVLLSDADLQVNAVAYLAQHLIVLLDPADIVVNLHHAYRRPEFREGHYASFHTGPSATADIEGVLIHGAQGDAHSQSCRFRAPPLMTLLTEIDRFGTCSLRNQVGVATMRSLVNATARGVRSGKLSAFERSALNQALAKALAFRDAGKMTEARQWAAELVRLLKSHDLLT
jgi:L-lactate utilization protein LutC